MDLDDAERHVIVLLLALAACAGSSADGEDPGASDTGDTASGDTGSGDTASGDTDTSDTASGDTDTGDTAVGLDAFVDRVVSYAPGAGAGFGQDRFPEIVYGPPEAPGGGSASVDVLSLGQEGEIVVAFDDLALVDGPGVDLLVFENPFTGWYETAVVAASEDGETWYEWPCDPTDAAGGYPGCAGVAIAYASSTNGVDPTDPEAAGGDRFDLADLGLTRARFVRIRDSGANSYEGVAGGFDLDAMAVVNGESVE